MNDDNHPQTPQDPGSGPADDAFPTYQPPPPPTPVNGQSNPPNPPAPPSEPRWAAVPPAPKAQRRRRTAVSVTVGAAVVLLGIAAGVFFTRPSATPVAAAATLDNNNANSHAGSGPDLRQGGVFFASNATSGNEVAAFVRTANGSLTRVGTYPTGGTGSGSFEDSSNPMLVGDTNGAIDPEHTNIKPEFVYTINAGSSSISVFRIEKNGLKLVDQVASGGQKPVSLAVHDGILYVLNSGEVENRLFLYNGLQPVGATENCTTGQLPTIDGFRIDNQGHLTQIVGSNRLLSNVAYSGCAQVSISPEGTAVIVSQRDAGKPASPTAFPKGNFEVFPLRPDGTTGDPIPVTPTGNGPFGFTWADDHTVVVSEQNGGFVDTLGGQTNAYTWDGNNLSLTANGPAVQTHTTDPCWIAITAKNSSGPQIAY
ncbi:MAG TPA: hypothetical protein VHV49_04780, partial [Pseudonocardiaceae bacterium]|nr:hypothetical protein [Pseudonocardiaceae bacterium]